MRNTLVVCVTISFLAALIMSVATPAGRTVASKPNDTFAADRAGIEKLRTADIDATLTQDPGALTALWSDEGVNLQSPDGPVVGLKALNELYARFRVEHPGFKVSKYSPSLRIFKSSRAGQLSPSMPTAPSGCLQRTIPLQFSKSSCEC